MEKQTYILKFPGSYGKTASFFANTLREALLDAVDDIDVHLKRVDPHTQTFGETLVLVLGAPAVVAAVNAIAGWLKRNPNATLEIEENGHIKATGLTSKDVLKLAELFSSQEKSSN